MKPSPLWVDSSTLTHCLAKVSPFVPRSASTSPNALVEPTGHLGANQRHTWGALQGASGTYQQRTGEVIPWELYKCLPGSRIKVCVEGKGRVREGGDKSQGWVCKTEEELALECCRTLAEWGGFPPSLQQSWANHHSWNRTTAALPLHTSLRELGSQLFST